MTRTSGAAAGEAPPVIELRGVSKRFGERLAVDGLDLAVPQGGCFGLLGPNGAGKTTTLKMIYGAASPSQGSVSVFGLDVARRPREVRARLGVTLQDNVLVESATPRENLAVFGRYYLMDKAAIAARIEALLDFLELRSHAEVPVRRLSGGFKRRLAVAMSLMNDPEALILDEPTTGLDPAVRQALWSRVRALGAEGKTVLITTHYMDEAERLCDQVLIMSHGKAICQGRPRTLIDEHLDREAIEFDSTPGEEARLLEGLDKRPKRLRAGDRLMMYTADATALAARIHELDGGTRRPVIVRPTNLEDVFLSVTGTRLEDDG